MDKVLRCDCGFEARAADEDALVAEVQRHAREAHGMQLSHDEALQRADRADPAATAEAVPRRERLPAPERKEER